MTSGDQLEEEVHFREVERPLLYADEAARKVCEIAAGLKRDGAGPHLVAALETAADSIRDDHKRMMKSVYFRAPGSGQAQFATDADENRLAA